MISTIERVASEIDRRTGGAGILNETEIWNSLLGKACNDAEIEVTRQFCTEALKNTSVLPDLNAALRFDVLAISEGMFREAQQLFRLKCTDERADLIQLIPKLIAAAELRTKEAVQHHLHRYRDELVHILTLCDQFMGKAEQEAAKSIDELDDAQVALFNLVACRRIISRRLTEEFEARVREKPESTRDFPDRVSEANRDIADAVQEFLHVRHTRRLHDVSPSNIQAVVRVMFPIGTILAMFGSQKPEWMETDWERLEEGRVLVSSGLDATMFAVGQKGGEKEHVHGTNSHVLTIPETPSHDHGTQVNRYTGANWNAVGTPAQLSHITSAYCNTVWTDYSVHIRTNSVGGNGGHDHGLTNPASCYPPYVCATFWRRTR
jgi:hypothetical protein